MTQVLYLASFGVISPIQKLWQKASFVSAMAASMINICIHVHVLTLIHVYSLNMALFLAYPIAHLWLKSLSPLQGSHSSDQGRVRGVPTLYSAFPLLCLPLFLSFWLPLFVCFYLCCCLSLLAPRVSFLVCHSHSSVIASSSLSSCPPFLLLPYPCKPW